MVEEKGREVIFRDIRRYKCEFCGICRSKKSLLSSHILSQHQEEMKEKETADNFQKEKEGKDQKANSCEECGLSFKKPAHLQQHMQCHSLQRLFACPVDDCPSSYRRNDHLTRHLLQHQGKLFSCPFDTCKKRFSFQGNMKRHVKEFHEEPSSNLNEPPKEYVCSESGCGKVFKYASKLLKHEDSHVKLETTEALCSDPGCMKYFANEECLKQHFQECHKHIICHICGTRQLKKNIKRHLRIHDAVVPSERIKCSFNGCLHTFSTKSNLNQHVKSVHMELKPFRCSFSGCGMTFSFKHVRDHHEKSGCHVYSDGDFVESDEQFRLRPRGGRKRKYPAVEALMRKRVVAHSESDILLNHGPAYLSRMLASEA